MTVSIKRLSRAAERLAPFALCALLATAAAARQQRERSSDRPAPQEARAAQTPVPAATPSPRPSTPPSQPPSQTSSETPSQQPARQVSEEEADLAITANVTASSLRFEAVPNVTVEFPGRPRRETAWEAERTNLPRPVQPGVTYRDVGVRLKIVSVFADIDRIVAEALGEVPPSDDAARPNASPPDTTTRAVGVPDINGATATDGTTRAGGAPATNNAASADGNAAGTDAAAATNRAADAPSRAAVSRRARTRAAGRQR